MCVCVCVCVCVCACACACAHMHALCTSLPGLLVDHSKIPPEKESEMLVSLTL